MTSANAAADSPVDRVVETAAAWPGVTTGRGRFGSTTLELAGREIGHVHAWGPVDVTYPGPIRDWFVESGLTGEHHVVPNSNATTYRVESEEDVDGAVTLLRVSYLYHASVLGRAGVELAEAVDLEAELDALGLPGEFLAVFVRTVRAG